MGILPGKDFLSAPSLIPQADVGSVAGKAQAPSTNPALQLATALKDLNPEAHQAAMAYAQDQADKQGAQAKIDALKTQGLDFAEATRRGLIEPTQNPWYMREYAVQAAQVKAQGELTKLNQDATSWAEQADPQQFQQRYSQELAQIAGNYKGQDAQEGFLAVARPAQEQAFGANTAQKVADIKQERIQNTGQLISQAISDANRVNGGQASPDQIMAAVGTLKEGWVGTGGTEAEWSKLVVAGFTSAAYNQQDPSLLDKIPDSVKNLPGVADAVSSDKYRITQTIQNDIRYANEAATAKITSEGLQLQSEAYADPRYGSKLLTGDFTVSQFIQDFQGKYTPMAIRSALNGIQAGVADSVSLNAARLKSYESDAANGPALLALHLEGETKGYTQELADKWGQLVIAGQVPFEDASRAINSAVSRSHAIKSQNIEAAKLDPTYINSYAKLTGRVDAAIGAMASQLQSARDGRTISTDDRQRITVTAKDAAGAWLLDHIGDFEGAGNAALKAVNDWYELKLKRKAQATSGSATGNPLRASTP